MRYTVISFPPHAGKPVSSDFRMLAYAIAGIRKIYCREVCIIDTDTGCCIDHYASGGGRAAFALRLRQAAPRRIAGARG